VSTAPLIPTVHLILGGARSGKSTYAESLVSALQPPYIYVATAQALDDEMKARVQAHQQRRKLNWETMEEPCALIDVLNRIGRRPRPVLIDCLTLWLSNLLINPSPTPPDQAVDTLCTFLETVNFPVFIVSNEVGSGIVPDNALAREFRDLAGFANQKVAKTASAVTMVIAGLPLRLK
jgi:adenosylcobinamide kinase / adenosylcobinamide-phosphate guanylyltransferase